MSAAENASPTSQADVASRFSIVARLLEHEAHRALDLLHAALDALEQDRLDDAHDVFFGVRLVLADHARDRARLLGAVRRTAAAADTCDRGSAGSPATRSRRSRRPSAPARGRADSSSASPAPCAPASRTAPGATRTAAACIRARAAPARNTGCRCPTRFPVPWSCLVVLCASGAIVTVRRSEQTTSMPHRTLQNARSPLRSWRRTSPTPTG